MSPTPSHTPGPWSVDSSVTNITESDREIDRYFAIHADGDADRGGSYIAVVEGDVFPREEQLANARLIASAPALLSALEAQEEADAAAATYRKAEANPPCGHNAEDTHNEWAVTLSDLAEDASKKAQKAIALRTTALAAAKATSL